MRIEIPELKRCCCCLPLRRGLIFWIYLKLAVVLLLILYFLAFIISISSRRFSTFPYVMTIISLILLLLDVGFNILFLISAHRKNDKHMKIFYRYAFVMLILQFLAMLGFIGLEIYVGIISMPYTILLIHYMTECTCFVFLQIVLHAYLVILVRSEVRKLERNATFEFTNHASEPECKAQIVA